MCPGPGQSARTFPPAQWWVRVSRAGVGHEEQQRLWQFLNRKVSHAGKWCPRHPCIGGAGSDWVPRKEALCCLGIKQGRRPPWNHRTWECAQLLQPRLSAASSHPRSWRLDIRATVRGRSQSWISRKMLPRSLLSSKAQPARRTGALICTQNPS